jgi:hypothetical protein
MDWFDRVPPRPRRFRRGWIALLLVVAIVAGAAGDAPTSAPVRQLLGDGAIEYRLIERTSPPQRIHVVLVDLTNPRVEVRVCRGGADPDGDGPWETTLATVPEIAKRENLIAAINGSMFGCKDAHDIAGIRDPYFTGNWAQAEGRTMSDGVAWSEHPRGLESPSLVVYADGTLRIAHFDNTAPVNARQIVSGARDLVKNGKNIAEPDARIDPRTAVGLAHDGKQLVLFVCDGDRPQEAVGLTVPQTADEMIALGCREAMTLDSGGSSTMVLRTRAAEWQVMNRPSDGHTVFMALSLTRPVANALGIVLHDTATTRPVDRR